MTWFRSLKGVLFLSFIALLTLVFRSYIDTRFILEEDYAHLGIEGALIWTFGYTAILGGWIWTLVAAARGSRRSQIVLLGYALVTSLGFGAASLLTFVSFPIEFLIFGANLVFGSLTALSGFFNLRQAA